MTTASPITDIHSTEKNAKKHIEDAKTQNNKKLIQTREEEEAKLMKLEEELRSVGKEKLGAAKKATAKSADEKLKKGKENAESMMKVAKDKMPEAVNKGVQVFLEHVGA